MDIPGKAIRDMTMEKITTVGHNMRIYMAHINSRQYEEKLGGTKWRHTLEDVSEEITAGVVCSISIAEHLIDRNVEVDSPYRSSHANGAVIDKTRTVLALRVHGMVKVVACVGEEDYWNTVWEVQQASLLDVVIARCLLWRDNTKYLYN